MDAILFLHYLPLDQGVTARHLSLFKSFNPDADVIPLKFADGRGNSEWQWRNADLMVYEWFDANSPTHDRFFVMEWDTLCLQSLKEFYGESYDANVAGSYIVHPWSSERMESGDRERDWHWWQHIDGEEAYKCARAILPLSGTLLSRAALSNIVQVWKTCRSLDSVLSEVRIGTLAVMAGHTPQAIRDDCKRFITWKDAKLEHGFGVYHRVK